MLSIRGLHVFYGGIHALRGIELDVPDGQIISLIGANGAGKSTTLKSIMGLVPKTEGTIMWNGRDITSIHTQRIVLITLFNILFNIKPPSTFGRRIIPHLYFL